METTRRGAAGEDQEMSLQAQTDDESSRKVYYTTWKVDGETPHVLVYHGPLLNHLLGVTIAIYFHHRCCWPMAWLVSKAMKCTSLCLVKGSCTWQRYRCTWSDSEWRRKIYRHKRQTCDDRWVQVVFFVCVCVFFFGAPWEVWRCIWFSISESQLPLFDGAEK